MQSKKTKSLVLSAVFLALGVVLPLLTGQIKEIGDSLLPMHLVVMLCGLICGAKYGMAVGALLPFVRSVTFGMPPLYPNAIWMSLELLTYGLVIGLIYSKAKKQSTLWLFFSLICSMIAGRVVWGIAKAILLGLGGKAFTLKMLVTGAIIDAIPGIVLQLVLIPIIINLVNYATKSITERKNQK